MVPVYDLAGAKDVISQVAQQGEGRRRISNLTGDHERFGQPKEVAHYFRFEQIISGRYYHREDDRNLSPTGRELRVDWNAVHPMKDDPGIDDQGPPGIGELLARFDQSYRRMLACLHKGFNGEKSELSNAVGAMHSLKHQSIALMQVPRDEGFETYGPPFWFVVSASGAQDENE